MENSPNIGTHKFWKPFVLVLKYELKLFLVSILVIKSTPNLDLIHTT
jgi:hypothetical protein